MALLSVSNSDRGKKLKTRAEREMRAKATPPPPAVLASGPPRRPHGGVVLFLVFLVLSCCCSVNGATMKLDQLEVKALRQIASKLKNKKWNFNKEPCSGAEGWVDPHPASSNLYVVNNLTCGVCNAIKDVCHVTSIQLMGQNLTGVLPDEFASLTFLNYLDLSRNYLSGSIPVAWATLPLINLSLPGNRISGSIPEELGNIRTLQSLVLDANQLQGPIPAALGNLTNLNRFLATANNFTGELPENLGNLKNMTDFRIDGNPISGKIPSFIGNWRKLQKLYMQGTSLEGPFPLSFATLESITELRVSDLKLGDGKFPPLQKLTIMTTLVLRNLSISGELPDYIGNMAVLKSLDLSFNKLTGHIPNSFGGLLYSIGHMYLTSNMLNGTIPDWILKGGAHLDLSYNNFTTPNAVSDCQLANLNLVSSYSSEDSTSIKPCLRRGNPCPVKAKNYQLFINCGGEKVTVGGIDYDGDSTPWGSSYYGEPEIGKWAYSSTGDFLDNDRANYIATNASLLSMDNAKLYMTARLSPLSLRYYGLCLQKGNYSVNLHFAEIMFTNNETYSSVGRRSFDVYIQGQKVLQDFNIAKEANGTGNEIIKNFNALVDGTLEIHFQWTGKGTQSIPQRSVYGPLISAISVRPNFKPDIGHNKLSVGVIWGIVAASCFALVLLSIFCWFICRRKHVEKNELRDLELQTGYFNLKQIKIATNKFDQSNKIGEGGFGPVYKGVLPDGSVIAVKQLSSKSKQGNREFVNEIGMISALQHPNLVKLFGCCVEGSQLLLIYEYMENNSLARALFGPKETRLKLDWETRHKICLGIARGLAYLHEESRLKIVHRDIKATNILLDKDLNAKISDFGLAKLDEEENTHISTRIAGTVGYMAPEYAMRGYLTDKADVYSFGVVVLEIVSGMSNTNFRPKEECVYLLDWAYVLQEQGNLLELVDSSLDSNYSQEEATQMLNLALVCTSPSPTLRPIMSTVVSMLGGRRPVQVPPTTGRVPQKSEGESMMKSKALQMISHDSQFQSQSSSSIDGPRVDDSLESVDQNSWMETTTIYPSTSLRSI